MEDYPDSNQYYQCPINVDVIRVQDSTIEELRTDTTTGFVTISYGVTDEYNLFHMERVTLIVSEDTMIQDRYGLTMSLNDLGVGMIVDVEYSPMMTRSIPPQSRAFRIIVVNRNLDSYTSVGRVLTIDFRNRILITGNANDIMSQIRYVITDTTSILDRYGYEIPLRNVRSGQLIRVEHAIFMTLSIPPQTTAYVVQII